MAIAETYPLTPLQQGMLFQHLKDPHAGVDIEQLVIQLREVVDDDRLLAAWQRVVARHPALRTRLRWEDCAAPGQEIVDHVDLDWRSITAAPAAARDRQGQIQAFLADDRRRGFALQQAPLLRWTLFRWAPNDCTLVWTFHHIILDGRSIAKVVGEVFELYDAKDAGGHAFTAAAPPPFSRFVEWLTAQNRQADDRFFRELLGDFSAPTPLVIDHAGLPAVGSHRQGEACESLDASTTDALRRLAAAHDLTMNALVMAAWAILLSRYSGESTVVFGATRACRRAPVEGVSEMVGLLINTLPVRVDLPEGATILEIARAVRQLWLALRPHEHLPLTLAKAASAIQGTLPLFETLVVFERQTLADALCGHGPAWASRTISLYELTSVPLTLAVYDGETLQFKLEHDLFRVSSDAAARTIGHLASLLTVFAGGLEQLVAQLNLLTTMERRELLTGFNTPRGLPPDHRFPFFCLHRRFEEQAARRPRAVALTCDGANLTYEDLNHRATALARILRSHGAGPDVLVGISMERSLDLVVGLLAILKAGAAYLPIDLAYPADRLAFMLEDAAAPVLLTQSHLADRLPATRARVIFVDQLPQAGIAGAHTEDLGVNVSPDHLAYVIYTSGTTGRPKGSMISHRNVARLFTATDHWYGFNETDVWTLFHSYAFDFSVWEIWGALLYGGRLVVVPFLTSRSPDAFYELLAREQVTVLNQTPSAFRQLIQAEEVVGQKELALRYVIFGGEALEMQSLRPWFQRHGDRLPQLVNMYGITETTVHVTYRPLSQDDLASGSVIGVPIPDLQIYILDPQRRPVPIGVPGEIFVGGEGLARGYLYRPDLTADRFLPDHLGGRPAGRLYRTGDLARFLPGGDIEYLGRIDHQVKIRGFRIELGEIESVLCQHAAVREALVLAREASPGNKQLAAYVVVNGTAPAVKELREHLRKKVPDYMVPATFVFLDKFPLTNNGKIDRKALPAPEHDRPELDATFVAPQTPVEETLAAIWAKVLRLERVGVMDNFFELGGDSILAIQLVSLARQTGLALSPKLLFQHQTIAELAASVTPTVQQPEAEQGLVQGPAPLTPIQHWFFEQELAEPHHYNQAFLFRVNEPLELAPLARALAHLEQHHDALRLRLAMPGHPREQTFAAPSATVLLEQMDLSTMNNGEVGNCIESAATRTQASLDFTQGPLWRVVYFDLGRGHAGRLLLAIHHLAVDGVSWRILIEDLERAYGQERSGQPARLPAKTTSVKEWAERLTDLVSRGDVPGGSQHWQTLASDAAGALPVELSRGENTEGSARTVTVRLGVAETEALLQQAPAAYGTQINDLLLAALGPTLAEWAGTENLLINLEGHGREDLFEGVDLSRTVGWFTTIYPVRLQLPAGGTAELIKSVKEQLRSVPARGIGFGLQRYLANDKQPASDPDPQILFNYLGQFDQVVSDSRLFGFAQEPIGPWHSPLARRRHLLEVNCLVVNGQLELGWTYSQNRHRAQTIELLTQRCRARLVEIIQHCTTPGVRGYTPSDFPLASLSQKALDTLAQRVADLDDVYPLSPIQTLFYTAAANDSKVVIDHWHGTLCGPLDLEKFQRAWELVFERHPVLRTSFQAADLPEPFQVVHRGMRSAWRVEDWRELSAPDQAARWAELLESDRGRGMDLAQAPLSRLATVQLGVQRYKFLWTVPALLLDGWSWPLVFRELSLVYDALCRSQSPALPAARLYRNYVAWLQARPWGETEEFWRSALSGVTEPTPLVADVVVTPPVADRRNAEWSVFLDPLISSRLVQLARQFQLTPNALIQAAWTLVLARLSGRSDVVFGAAFSGRPPDMVGAAETVGPFVNNLPVRVRVNGSTSVRTFLQDLHAQLLRLNEHQFAPLARIQSWTEVPWRHRLFDSLVVVQNYQVDAAARRLGDSVVISDFVGPIHTNFPLLVLVELEESWRFTLIYDVRELPEAAIQRWGQDMVHALGDFVANPDAAVAGLLAQLNPPVKSSPTKRRWRAASQNYVRPQNELEARLAQVWEEMLQLEKISTEENFFDLGAHSLLVVQLHRRLCATIGQDFPLVTMFQFPTVQSLARHLNRQAEGNLGNGEVRTRAQRQREAMSRLRTGGKHQ